MLVSGVQHSHCGIHRYCFMFFSIMVYYRILNIVACAIQQDLVILYMIVCISGCWGSDTTERLHFHFSLSCSGEGSGNPLQCFCLENPMDRGIWWATVHRVAKSQTRLKWLGTHTHGIVTEFWHLLWKLQQKILNEFRIWYIVSN